MMLLKLCAIMGMMALVAVVLNRLFPADKEKSEPRSLNDLMHELDQEDEASSEPVDKD